MPAAASARSQVRLHSVADVDVRAMCVADLLNESEDLSVCPWVVTQD